MSRIQPRALGTKDLESEAARSIWAMVLVPNLKMRTQIIRTLIKAFGHPLHIATSNRNIGS